MDDKKQQIAWHATDSFKDYLEQRRQLLIQELKWIERTLCLPSSVITGKDRRRMQAELTV